MPRVARRVLIVDDHASFRTSMRTLLESEGYEVAGEAENGVAALRLANELHPDVVLLDVHLPDFDGFEIASRLSQTADPPVVVLTSVRSDYAAVTNLGGAAGFIPKDELTPSALAALLA
jgi:DNA-binding NarL/FixJ family response regulator